MWKEILNFIVTGITEAICSNCVEKKKRTKLNNKVSVIVVESMNSFADTSLDCDEIYSLVQSRKFVEMLRGLFCSLKDGYSSEDYIEYVEKYICKECPRSKHTEVREFIRKIQLLYEKNLYKIINENPELNVMFQLLTISHREIISKIIESENNLMKYLDSLDNTKKQISSDEIKAYHDVCKKEYGVMRFTGISGAENRKAQDINEFYVENKFSYYITKEFEGIYRYGIDKIEPIEIKDFFNLGNKIVLIGAAGLGKSTTLNYLFCNYEKMYNAYAIKIKIDLKEYAKEIGENKRDLLWCIATEFSKKIKRANMTFGDTERFLGEYLQEGKCLIILDALDEIPTQVMRNKVRDEIGVFSEMYYLNRFIISTREAGYLRNRFDDSFLHVKINDFENEQIEKYSKNWFCSNYVESEFNEFWTKFCIEVERARCRNLIRNPIVLILALIIFDIEKNLPNQRVEFYKKCIETFLKVREDRKGAYILCEKAKNILGIDLVLPKIAYYKFKNISKNIDYKFNYEELKNSVLVAIEVTDVINWSDAVVQYSEYLIERTELIREIDEDILDFTHKTFYEYFLAVYFTKEMNNDDMMKLLADWIGDSNYDELARLIIEVIIQNDDPEQHKCIMEYLFNEVCVPLEDVGKPNNKQDIFMIIADIYNHNMLQPKFHTLYNKTILYYPRYVELANSLLRHSESKVKYDSDILANMYYEEILTSKNFGETLDSLYYLDNEYKRNVVSKLNEEYVNHISNIFSLVHNFNTKKITKRVLEKRCCNELNYFMNEGLEYVLNYSQIFVAVVYTMILTNDYSEIEKIFNYSFKDNTSFFHYSSPEILLNLVEESRKNKNIFVVLLILIIACSKNRTNILIGFLLDFEEREKNVEIGKNQIADFSHWLWEILNTSKSVDEFKTKIKEKNLYISGCVGIYERLYRDYTEREKGRLDYRIRKHTKGRVE